MFELIGGFVALTIAGHAMWWTLTSLLYPVFVVWMIVDALLRDAPDWPGGGRNDKLIWVLLMVLVHPAAFAYLLLVYLRVKRGSAYAPARATPAA